MNYCCYQRSLRSYSVYTYMSHVVQTNTTTGRYPNIFLDFYKMYPKDFYLHNKLSSLGLSGKLRFLYRFDFFFDGVLLALLIWTQRLTTVFHYLIYHIISKDRLRTINIVIFCAFNEILMCSGHSVFYVCIVLLNV